MSISSSSRRNDDNSIFCKIDIIKDIISKKNSSGD